MVVNMPPLKSKQDLRKSSEELLTLLSRISQNKIQHPDSNESGFFVLKVNICKKSLSITLCSLT